jgi:anti-anti-sigma regulatory factor
VWTALLDELVALGPSRVLLEAEGISSVGSSALAGLVRAADRARAEGWRIDLLRCPERIWLVIQMLGLDVFMAEFRSIPEALAEPIEPPRRAAATPAWLLGLARWGPAACARAALGIAAAPAKDEPPDRRAAWRALAADVQARGAWDVRRLDERADWAPLDRASVHAALADWVLGEL